MNKALACAAVLALSACVTTPISAPGPSLPSGPTIPSGPLDLGGDWRRLGETAVLRGFEEAVSQRYAIGLRLDAAAVDLRGADFNCARNTDTRGDPPAEICRRTQTVNGCTHTWQVHLFDSGEAATLTRARGLYDRRCGDDGLLGGPG